MAKKVTLGFFGDDLRLEPLKNYEISENGKKIKVHTGGKNHWHVGFGTTSFLEFPVRYPWSFWKTSYKRIYLAHKDAKNCIDFHTDKVEGPDPELVKRQASTIIVDKIGKTKQETPTFIYILLVINLLFSFLIAHVLGVF